MGLRHPQSKWIQVRVSQKSCLRTTFFRKLWFWPILTQLTTPPWYISLESYKSQLSCCLAPTQLSWTCRASVFGKASAKLYPLSETLSYPLPIYFQYIPTVRLILIMIKSILPWEWWENVMLKYISNTFLTIGSCKEQILHFLGECPITIMRMIKEILVYSKFRSL